MILTQAEIQAIADTCHTFGYDFRLALRTAARDGRPYYRRPSDSYEAQRERALGAREVHAA